jgi:hypothetical protein
MLYALAIILLFTFTVLIQTRFEALGMIPVAYLSAGVSFAFLLHQVITRFSLNKLINRRFVTAAFFIWIFLFFINSVLHGFGRFVIDSKAVVEALFLIFRLIEFFMSLYSIVLFIIFLMDNRVLANLKRWLLFVAGAGTVRFVVLLVFYPEPVLLFRYDGIFDLVILFGLLMILFVAIRQEHLVE